MNKTLWPAASDSCNTISATASRTTPGIPADTPPRRDGSSGSPDRNTSCPWRPGDATPAVPLRDCPPPANTARRERGHGGTPGATASGRTNQSTSSRVPAETANARTPGCCLCTPPSATHCPCSDLTHGRWHLSAAGRLRG
mmetsp:Transcript_4056/g.5832  ORF Transcript_4056/g.5832 Transcript_4056/m.5832 type:complete len:141 (-) Transcript_4056:741-1163(-)